MADRVRASASSRPPTAENLSGTEVRRRFDERYGQVVGPGSTDAAFASESKRYGYGGGEVDEGQLTSYLDQRTADYRAANKPKASTQQEPAAGASTGGSSPAMSGLSSAFSGGGGGGSGAEIAMPMPIMDQGEPSPSNPALGQRNLPMQGLKLALMRGRIY